MAGQQQFFFPQSVRKGGGGKKGKKVGWPYVYHALIGAGYGQSPAEIGRLTSRQIDLFFVECEKAKKERRRARLSDINAAFAGGPRAKQLMKDLE